MTGSWHHGLIARWWAEVNSPEAAELDYLRTALARFGTPALDLGCGAGRLLLPLLAEGLDVDGIDVSADMIAQLRAGAARQGLDVEGRLDVQAFDQLDRQRSYRTVFSIGSFAIGGRPDRDAEALRRIRGHLLPGGAAILSYEVLTDEDHVAFADPARAYPDPWPDTGSTATLADGDELELRVRTAGYDSSSRTRRLELVARLRHGGTVIQEERGELLNTYYPLDTLASMLRGAGYTEIVVEGPYTGRPPAAGDTTIVIVAR